MSTEPFVMPPSFDPVTAICSRGKFGPGQTYDAELRIYGVQYCLQTGFKTREEAQKLADSVKEELTDALKTIVTHFTKGWKAAKE